MRPNPSATPPSTKDESAFLAGILANKAFSALIPGTRSGRGNHGAIRGLRAGRARDCSCPSVGANGTSYSGEKELPNAALQLCKEPKPAENRSPDSCSCIYLSTNGAILARKVCHLQIWWGSKSTITSFWQQLLRTSPQLPQCQDNLPVM